MSATEPTLYFAFMAPPSLTNLSRVLGSGTSVLSGLALRKSHSVSASVSKLSEHSPTASRPRVILGFLSSQADRPRTRLPPMSAGFHMRCSLGGRAWPGKDHQPHAKEPP